MKEQILKRARELGFDDCRVTSADAPEHGAKLREWLAGGQQGEMAWMARNAEKRGEPGRVLEGARSIITLAVGYGNEGMTSEAFPASRGTQAVHGSAAGTAALRGVIARYARYADYHDVVAERLKELTAFVNELGGPGARSLWYVDTGPLLERELVQRAGLGFVGKHTNLISRKLGNWLFICEIITTLDLEPDSPERNRCGTCTRCITACPTGAITEPFNVDARLCISYLTIELKSSIPLELRPLIGNRIYGCDDCLAVCPWNRFAQEATIMQPHQRADLAAPDLIELLSLDDAGFKARFAGMPILRTKRRGLLRNVCVALGNLGDERALPALERATHDAEPLIREHAVWAMERLKTED